MLDLQDRILAKDWARIRRFALFVCLMPLSAMLIEFSIDSLVIAHFLGMEQVGLYSFAVMIMTLLGNLNPAMALKNIVSHVFIRKYTESKRPEILDEGNQTVLKLTSFVLFPTFGTVAILIHPIIEYLFHAKFLPAVPTIYCLLFFFFLQNTFIYGLSHIFNTMEKLELRFYGYTVIGIYNLVLEIILIPKFGILGVGLATGSAALLTCGFYYIMVRRVIGIRLHIPKLALGKIFAASSIAFIPQLVFRHSVKGPFILIGLCAGTALIYLFAIQRMHPFNKRESELINGAIGRPLF